MVTTTMQPSHTVKKNIKESQHLYPLWSLGEKNINIQTHWAILWQQAKESNSFCTKTGPSSPSSTLSKASVSLLPRRAGVCSLFNPVRKIIHNRGRPSIWQNFFPSGVLLVGLLRLAGRSLIRGHVQKFRRKKTENLKNIFSSEEKSRITVFL